MQGLENLANRVRQLEREKREAVAKAEMLERDQRQSAATIAALERAEKQAAATIEALERAEKQAAITIQELEHDKKQATVTIRGLEREVGELGALIALASAKVDEIMKDGAAPDMPQPAAVSVPREARSLERVEEMPAAPRGEPKDRSSKAWRFD